MMSQQPNSGSAREVYQPRLTPQLRRLYNMSSRRCFFEAGIALPLHASRRSMASAFRELRRMATDSFPPLAATRFRIGRTRRPVVRREEPTRAGLLTKGLVRLRRTSRTHERSVMRTATPLRKRRSPTAVAGAGSTTSPHNARTRFTTISCWANPQSRSGGDQSGPHTTAF